MVEVDANIKFATNLPLGFGMNITDVEWVVPMVAKPFIPVAAGTVTNDWQIVAQLTEALARTSVAQTDNIDIDIYFDEFGIANVNTTAVAQQPYLFNRVKALERHKLQRPWLSVAQNLNLILSVIPTESVNTNGPEVQVYCRIFFDIVTLTAAQQAYLSQRIQISGQA